MTILDELSETQSFTERTLKYGRNLMATSVPMIVFSLVPMVDIAKSRPFNFELQEGGEFWLWGFLLTLLMYYGIKFIGLVIIDYHHWYEVHGDYKDNLNIDLLRQGNAIVEGMRELDTARYNFSHSRPSNAEEHTRNFEKAQSNLAASKIHIKTSKFKIRDYNWRRAYFWIADAGLPLLLFLIALGATVEKVLTYQYLFFPYVSYNPF